MVTRYGEMRDMITCLQIEKGELVAVQKNVKKTWTYEEAMALE